ncbi:MAG: hypothetical protein Q9161_008793 [Pseudevernia consocians]
MQSLGIAAVTSPSTFDELINSLGSLGDGKAVTPFGSLNNFITADATGAGSPSYIKQEATYWSNQQAETEPRCRTQPQSALQVSASLLITKFFGCQFAVKSGGHAMFAGASNIQGGLTIDLANLNQIRVSQDRTLTHVGTGNRWVDVYRQLDQQQLSVIGGRVAGIGVGGLTLGGGISFFSGRHGLACDNVRNYEVVLANASIANINHTSDPDLYFALRGGGNNFGIVTRFDLETFPQGLMWGGSRFYPITANASLITAFDNFAANGPSDPDAALIVAFYYYNGTFGSSTDMEYAKPTINPPIFHELMGIESLTSTMRITNLTNLTLELEASNPTGFRDTYFTATFKPSALLSQEILSIFMDEVSAIKDAASIVPSVVFQPVTKDIISHFSKNGGNALGIAESDGPLNLVDIAISWSSPSDDSRVMAAASNFIDRSTAAAKDMGLDYKFIYQNYAAKSQDVFGGYGEANQQRLIKISEDYDPERVFQELQPGYFKLKG